MVSTRILSVRSKPFAVRMCAASPTLELFKPLSHFAGLQSPELIFTFRTSQAAKAQNYFRLSHCARHSQPSYKWGCLLTEYWKYCARAQARARPMGRGGGEGGEGHKYHICLANPHLPSKFSFALRIPHLFGKS